jgi:hypothetical protein
MFGKIELEGDSKVQVDGILSLHGSDHVMTLTLAVETKGNSLSVRTHVVIPYVEWGLNNPSTFLLHVRRQGGGRRHRGGPGSRAGETSLSLSVVAFFTMGVRPPFVPFWNYRVEPRPRAKVFAFTMVGGLSQIHIIL